MRPRPNSSLRTGGRLSIPRPLAALHRVLRSRALSSAVEHFLDMEGVRGSIPLAPTIRCLKYLSSEGGGIFCAARRGTIRNGRDGPGNFRGPRLQVVLAFACVFYGISRGASREGVLGRVWAMEVV